jgi:hypothetical protein
MPEIYFKRTAGPPRLPLHEQYEVQRVPGYAMASQGLLRWSDDTAQWVYIPWVPDHQPMQELSALDLRLIANWLDRSPTSNDATPSLFTPPTQEIPKQ